MKLKTTPWIEFKKLFSVLVFILKSTFRASLFKDADSRLLLSLIYLKKLNANTEIELVKVEIPEDHLFILSSFVYQDLNSDIEKRLMKLTLKEILSLLVLIKKFKPRKIFEFGLYGGGSLYHFFLNTDDSVLLYSLDYDLTNLADFIRKIFNENPRIQIMQQNSLQFDPGPYLGLMDFIFIDGGHEYEVVKKDSENAFKMLNKKGIIVWDDYNKFCSGIFRYLNETQARGIKLSHIKDTSLVYFQNE